jgi:ABC-type transport system involved in multi-copper enzyme maturation permease subunit
VPPNSPIKGLRCSFCASFDRTWGRPIATGLLPVVTNANEWSFIISVFIFTFTLMLGVLVFGLNKGLEKNVQVQYKYIHIVGIRVPAVFAFLLLPFVFPDHIVAMLPLGSLITCVFLFTSVLVYKKMEMNRSGKAIQM